VLHVVAEWLMDDMSAHCTPRLLPILLHGVGDEQEAVRDACVVLVDKVCVSIHMYIHTWCSSTMFAYIHT
jgi:hypothetical protein